MPMKTYVAIASYFEASKNCARSNNEEWRVKHLATIDQIVADYLPSGSGFDSGVTFEPGQSTLNRLIFTTSFHHVNEVGYYDGWTDHQVIISASLAHGFDVRVTGRDYNGIKDAIAEVFTEGLNQDVES